MKFLVTKMKEMPYFFNFNAALNKHDNLYCKLEFKILRIFFFGMHVALEGSGNSDCLNIRITKTYLVFVHANKYSKTNENGISSSFHVSSLIWQSDIH